MNDFIKAVASKIWPFSLFMHRIQELHRRNAEVQQDLTQQLLAKQQEMDRQVQELQQKIYAAQQHILELNRNGTYISWAQVEKSRQIASQYQLWRADNFIREVINHPELFDEIEGLFTDEESLRTFRWLVIYRFLTPLFGDSELWWESEVSLLYHIFPGPVSDKQYQETFAQAEDAVAAQSLALFAEPYCIWHTFILKQYQYDDVFQFKTGDVVFDIGGYVGDTALFFSELVGENGLVYTFEPSPGNGEKIKKNIDHFGRKNIRLIPMALSDSIGEQTFSEMASSGAMFSDSGITVQTTTIDQFVLENRIKKVSVIKMDVEGAEDAVLRGGIETIRRLCPVLLVSVYHRSYADLTQLTLWLKNALPFLR